MVSSNKQWQKQQRKQESHPHHLRSCGIRLSARQEKNKKKQKEWHLLLDMKSSDVAVSSKLLVSSRQRQNPVLRSLKNVPYEFAELPCDYHVSSEVGALYLSMRYHLLNPRYILGRLDALLGYRVRVLVLLMDSEVAETELVQLSCDAVSKHATLLVGFSELECARYLETLKLYEKKPPDLIRGEPASQRHEDVFAECVTVVKSVNQSDAAQLGTTFGTMQNLATARVEELLLCPGMGMKKAKRIVDMFENPL